MRGFKNRVPLRNYKSVNHDSLSRSQVEVIQEQRRDTTLLERGVPLNVWIFFVIMRVCFYPICFSISQNWWAAPPPANNERASPPAWAVVAPRLLFTPLLPASMALPPLPRRLLAIHYSKALHKLHRRHQLRKFEDDKFLRVKCINHDLRRLVHYTLENISSSILLSLCYLWSFPKCFRLMNAFEVEWFRLKGKLFFDLVFIMRRVSEWIEAVH